MIRLVASTIIERPMLVRSGSKPTVQQCFEQHIVELPNMIRWFRNAIVSVSREFKWVKLALLRKGIPIEIFSMIKPYLITHGEKDFFPTVACDQWVAHRKYLLIESKLCRLELANEKTIERIRTYIFDYYDSREETKHGIWPIRQFKQDSRRREFINYVLYLRYVTTGDCSIDKSEAEYMMQYWY
jgi:hypothetical protein